jgi:hypothetical protein
VPLLDIAVDGMLLDLTSLFLVLTSRTGWALTLLSDENLSYASTCQTIGLNTGYFASFTVFLALNSEAFRCVSVIRSMPAFV